MTFRERLLYGMKFTVSRQALDRRDFVSHRARSEHQAAPNSHTVQEHRTASANPLLTPDMSASQLEIVTEAIGK
jgi:hypothetical protein